MYDPFKSVDENQDRLMPNSRRGRRSDYGSIIRNFQPTLIPPNFSRDMQVFNFKTLVTEDEKAALAFSSDGAGLLSKIISFDVSEIPNFSTLVSLFREYRVNSWQLNLLQTKTDNTDGQFSLRSADTFDALGADLLKEIKSGAQLFNYADIQRIVTIGWKGSTDIDRAWQEARTSSPFTDYDKIFIKGNTFPTSTLLFTGFFSVNITFRGIK